MTIQHLTPSDYITTKWSGGLTTQLGIAPASAVYADRDFLWRLSSATVEAAYEVHRFDGGDDTHSWGRCRDFNLMLRKGKCEGKMRGEHLAALEHKTVHGCEGMTLIYCGVGEVHVIVGDESVELKADEAARLDGYAGEIKLCSKTGAKLMLAKAKEI